MKTIIKVAFILFILSTACSYTADFTKQDLDFMIIQDAPEETGATCEDDCDCTLFGPCYSCQGGFCALALNADQDHDGYLNAECDVDPSCGSERGWTENFWPGKGDDCDDSNPDINPGAVDKCNGMDDNCNGLKDEDASTFGPEKDIIKLVENSYHFSYCPFGENSYIVWDDDPEGANVRSGFFNASGILLNSEIMTESGFGPHICCAPGIGPISVYSDRGHGKADIVLRRLDMFGGPDPDMLTITDDIESAGDMTDAVIAYLPYTTPPLIGVAWLTHDIDDIAMGRVNFRVFDSITNNPVEMDITGLPTQQFQIPGNYPAFSFEKLNIDTYAIHGEGETVVEQGFALFWNETAGGTDGIYFATISCGRNATSGMKCSGKVEDPYRPANRIRFPDFEWAGDRFIAAYASMASDTDLPGLEFAEIAKGTDGWSFNPLLLDLSAETLMIEGRAHTYPSLEWVDDMDEIILAWSNEIEFGKRIIKFARLYRNETTDLPDVPLSLVVPRVFNISADSAEETGFAGAPEVLYRSSVIAEGFIVAWTERGGEAGASVEIKTRTVRCISEE